MREFSFSDDELKAIAKDRYEHPHPHVLRKMEVLWLKSHGLPHEQVAKLAGVSLRTVQRYLDEYLEGGLEQIRRCKWRGPKTELLQHEQSIQEYFWDHPPRNTKEAAKVIFEQTGVRRGLTQVRAFLKTQGAELEVLMSLGGWRTTSMPMRYGRAQSSTRAIEAYQRMGSPVDRAAAKRNA